MVRVREDEGDSKDNDDNIGARGQQRCCRCRIVGRPRMRVRALVRVHEDEDEGLKGDDKGDGDDDSDIVARGQ